MTTRILGVCALTLFEQAKGYLFNEGDTPAIDFSKWVNENKDTILSEEVTTWIQERNSQLLGMYPHWQQHVYVLALVQPNRGAHKAAFQWMDEQAKVLNISEALMIDSLINLYFTQKKEV